MMGRRVQLLARARRGKTNLKLKSFQLSFRSETFGAGDALALRISQGYCVARFASVEQGNGTFHPWQADGSPKATGESMALIISAIVHVFGFSET